MRKRLQFFAQTLVGLSLCGVLAGGPEGIPGAGIHSWAGWKPGQVSQEDCPELRGVPLILKWQELEPSDGNYEFDKYLGKPLKSAHQDGLYATLMIWVGPAAPEWIYEAGVPEVRTDRTVNALGQATKDNKFPYYFAPVYRDRFFRLIDAFAAYVNALPPAVRERIVFVQAAEGSTGDGQPYKGSPLKPQYEISSEAWNEFRQETWERYRAGLRDIPVLVNSDANEDAQRDWLLEHMDVIALKHGMFSHGYHVSDNRKRLAQFQTTTALAQARGKPVLSRGEMDGELFVMGWSKRNIPQALYWSGLFATHCNLDIWNVPNKALKDEANWPALAYFNKFAGQRDAASAASAFCALRDGLDASDFDRFPENPFGGKPGKKNTPERYLKIAEAFAPYGARVDDIAKALGGGMLNRKRTGSNDVGWGILPSNYERFLTQVESGTGDVGWWNIDDSIYGRFARGFQHETGKTRLAFKLHDRFFADAGRPRDVAVTIVLLDQGFGSWSVNYAGERGDSRMVKIRNENSGDWVTHRVVLTGAVFNGALRGADLNLEYMGGDDTIFHLVELERLP
jgi:hypothetical protein